MKKIFHNRSAIQAFILLFLGFLAILVASLFVFTVYQNHTRYQRSKQRFAYSFMRGVSLGRAIQPEKLRHHLWQLDARGLRFRLANQAAPKSIEIYPYTYGKKLRAIAAKNYKKFTASILLSDGRWLIARSWHRSYPWFWLGISVSLLLLLSALVFLCWFVIARLSLPINDFIIAAKRFGVDIQSPPLAVTGPPELQAVTKAFNEMQDRIRRLIHDRTQMLAAISHDLRTPITRLQLRAEYLKDTPQYEKAVADLDEMDNMIASILSFAREYASSEVMERFDINALLETLCDEMVDVGNKVTYQGTENRVVMLGRLSGLKRAFSNLVDNAVKYGDEAKVSLNIVNAKLQVKISDQGPGIPEDEREKVFAPFYRVDKSRSPQKAGTGLGMAVARDIVRSHGGDIVLHNRDPRGLMVVVTLPL